MKKKTKKLALAKEIVRKLEEDRNFGRVAGGIIIIEDGTRSEYWSCVCAESEIYTCKC